MAPALGIAPFNKKQLQLTPGPRQQLSLLEKLHFGLILVAPLFTVIPASIIKNYILLRFMSPVVQLGRPVTGFIAQFVSQHFFGRTSVAQARLVFNRDGSYKKVFAGPAFEGIRDWVARVDREDGVSGWWIAPPTTKRTDDDVVMLYIHGGGFVLDTGAAVQGFYAHLAKELNIKRNVKFSVFTLDYELAPDFQYPSQLIETLSAYNYLVNTLGVSEDRIVLLGDSAGGNLISAFMLHLARPNPAIKLPSSSQHSKLQAPRAAIIVSPMTNLTSTSPSRQTNAAYDVIDDGTCFRMAHQYVGAPLPRGTRSTPSWMPWFVGRGFPNSSPHSTFSVFKETKPLEAEDGDKSRRLGSPYANPSVCRDSDWWLKALPGDGRTMVTWGGREIFADDDKEFFSVLETAGVKPVKLYKAHGVHNWPLFDAVIDGLYKTNSTGPDNHPMYGLQRIADFLEDVFRKAL